MATLALVTAIRKALAAVADADAAPQMQAYMKTAQPFHGVKTPARTAIVRQALQDHPPTTLKDYREAVTQLWTGGFREEQYAALDVAERVTRFRTPANWGFYERLLRQAQNWDTVDRIAPFLLGGLLHEDRALAAHIKAWPTDHNLWVRRASLVIHLKHKGDTDTRLLGSTILSLAHDPDFFIRKAIGWTLREYAKTDAAWVRRFTREHKAALSPLSLREATRNL